MFKFALIVILFAPDFSGYADQVAMHDTLVECEAAKEQVLRNRPIRQHPGAHFVIECVKTKPMKSLDA